MHNQGPTLLLLIWFILVGAAAASLVGDLPAQAHDDERAEAFQRLVGGLGLGPAVDLSRCPFSFDPRLGCTCGDHHGPLPGGAWLCPHHACSVFYYPPLDCANRNPSDVEIP